MTVMELCVCFSTNVKYMQRGSPTQPTHMKIALLLCVVLEKHSRACESKFWWIYTFGTLGQD